MSNLEEHAQRELDLAGLFDADADYNGELGKAVMEMVSVFAKQGHSGYSAFMSVDILNRLLSYEPLTPLTDDPEEWVEVAKDQWQSKRNPKAFSKDGGKSYTVLDTNGKIEVSAPKKPKKPKQN